MIYLSKSTAKTAKSTIFFSFSEKILLFINGKKLASTFFKKDVANQAILEPLMKLKSLTSSNFLLDIFVSGGGRISQITAISKAISKIIYMFLPKSKKSLLDIFSNFSNTRFKERKKLGLKKSRKKTQYSKR